MYTNSMGYDQDGRPVKRPRHVSSMAGENLHHLNTAGMESSDTVGMGMKMNTTSDNNHKNIRAEGHLLLSTSTASPASRGRTDDKNNRKLSCKECRRQVNFPLLFFYTFMFFF